MSRPALKLTYARTEARSYDIEYHLIGCSCEHCQPVPPALPLARLTIAGIVVGNLIAFAADPAGSIHTLASSLAHLIGMR